MLPLLRNLAVPCRLQRASHIQKCPSVTSLGGEQTVGIGGMSGESSRRADDAKEKEDEAELVKRLEDVSARLPPGYIVSPVRGQHRKGCEMCNKTTWVSPLNRPSKPRRCMKSFPLNPPFSDLWEGGV